VSVERPPTPPEFDASRARERRADPAAWRFDADERAAIWRALAERRDIRRFRPDPIPDELLTRLLGAAHMAPSVGLMQPWRFIVVRDEATKAEMHAVASRERLIQADHLDARAGEFLDLKLEGIREAPVSVCVCCDRAPGREILGRHTITDTDLYSTAAAIQNLWLAARAEGVGIGWVSFYEEDAVRALLGIPAHVVPVAWLCVGYPDERPVRPGLEAAGWGARHPLSDHVFAERWGALDEPGLKAEATARPSPSEVHAPAWWRRLADGIVPADHAAAVATRDASDELIKPAGSLGVLEGALERWAAATGGPPRAEASAAILVLCADHGVAGQGVSLFPARVGAQVAAAAARGESAIGVLARALGAELVVADVGLRGAAPGDGVRALRVADGSADLSLGPALSAAQVRAAVEVGFALGGELAARSELVVLGEIGIGNTTVAASLLAALTGLPPQAVCGRGTGVDAQGLERKREVVARALAVNAVDAVDAVAGADPIGCLGAVGGLELAALCGAMLACAAQRRVVLLDGFAVGVAALAACRATPALRDYLLAGHCSAEPAHALVLTELGLEPLLRGRLRLGEASGAALAVPLLRLAGRLHAEMGRFADAGVDRA
jgi:nicotinate-nucleotide--dimethylbenzimidazole phosphoribosyltransferase